jgi:pSer/pThr/pTyr-binding forkhead associated (FHA) protein
VSLRHASIRAQGSEFAIVDEGSSNGTWVGGVRLSPQTPRLVRTGDLVRLGRVWLEIMIGQKPPTIDLGLATRDLALALVRNAMAATGDDTLPKLRVVEGPDMGAELRLVQDTRVYVIGRAERCDLPLADEDASREHATVVRRGAHILVTDLRSSNGVFLGDTKLVPERDTPWRPPMMLRIGQSVLALDEPVSRALAELEAAADEPLPEERAPPPPPAEPPPHAPTPEPPPASTGLPESRAHVEAPIAAVNPRLAATVPARRRGKSRSWTAADIAVVTIAVLVIGVSIAGLVWVLK